MMILVISIFNYSSKVFSQIRLSCLVVLKDVLLLGELFEELEHHACLIKACILLVIKPHHHLLGKLCISTFKNERS